jgi:uncharacterized protein involved in response to NO
MGVVIYGMVFRIALGHMGRPIHAAPIVQAGYVLMNLAALARVIGPLAAARFYNGSLFLAGALWAAAFTLLLLHYTPILLKPREVG